MAQRMGTWRGSGLSQGQYAQSYNLCKSYNRLRILVDDSRIWPGSEAKKSELLRIFSARIRMIENSCDEAAGGDEEISEMLLRNAGYGLPYSKMADPAVTETVFYQLRKDLYRLVYLKLTANPAEYGYIQVEGKDYVIPAQDFI